MRVLLVPVLVYAAILTAAMNSHPMFPLNPSKVNNSTQPDHSLDFKRQSDCYGGE